MMENKQAAVLFHHVSKTYKLYANDKQRFKAIFSSQIKYTPKLAVNNVSFEIKKGESVAILGKNGAGKSTILKMIAGVAYPSSGLIRVKGRVSALLELSAGFNQQMTGRENIYFRGEILGIDRSVLKTLENEIIQFAEIGDYIDQPVSKYSSGMRARLGFAINVIVKPNVIIVDEALSVGDRSFREKCNKKINEILGDGTTFIFVTHSTAEAKKFCRRGLVMRNGCLLFDGKIDPAVSFYEELLKNEG